jgi:hypothetical protein
MKRSMLAAAFAAMALAAPAHAEVKASAPDRLELHFEREVPGSAAQVWARVVRPGTWWSDAHTYSGKASNMRLAERAGGCWCEIWAGGQVEHGRVVSIMPGQLLRIETALGPLQEMGVTGALTITLSPGAAAGTTKITMDYKVSGSSAVHLDQLAAPVNGVMGEQFNRLVGGEG